MSVRETMGRAIAVLALVAAPGVLRGQDALTITIRGLPSTTPAPVALVQNGQRRVIGQTDAGGAVQLDMRQANIGKGKRVNVKLDTRNTPTVVLVPEGEKDNDCENDRNPPPPPPPGQQRDRDPCLPIGFFVFDGATAITIDATGSIPRVVTQGPQVPVESSPKAPLLARKKWVLGGGLEYNNFGNFKKTVGDQTDLTGVTGDNTFIGYNAFVERKLPCDWFDLFLGLAFHYGTQDFTQTYQSSNPLFPTRASGTVTGTFGDFYIGAQRLVMRRFTVHGLFGGTYAINTLALETRWGDLLDSETRTLTSFKSTIGVGADVPITEVFGARMGYRLTAGKTFNEADFAQRFGLSATVRF
jgi:hypothetical protein